MSIIQRLHSSIKVKDHNFPKTWNQKELLLGNSSYVISYLCSMKTRRGGLVMLWAFNIPHPSRILSPSFVGTLQLSPIRMASFGSRYWGYAHNDGQCALNWKKGVGYSSPHSKLKTCCGGKDKLIAAYWAAYNAKSTGTNNIHAAIQQAADFTPEETALNDWLTMIILKNWSLTSVECKLHCYMCKHRTTFSCKQICMMIHPWGGC
jgi:hypothetical protein